MARQKNNSGLPNFEQAQQQPYPESPVAVSQNVAAIGSPLEEALLRPRGICPIVLRQTTKPTGRGVQKPHAAFCIASCLLVMTFDVLHAGLQQQADKQTSCTLQRTCSLGSSKILRPPSFRNSLHSAVQQHTCLSSVHNV